MSSGEDEPTRERPRTPAPEDPTRREGGAVRAADEAAADSEDRRGPATANAEDWGIGDTIGPYRLVRHLGAGGMGTVYLAEQLQPVRRLVALKLVAKPLESSGEADLRFAAEQQALALLSHPNVARLYETGRTPSGHPFMAMEFVDGVPITAYCDRHKADLRSRLELFSDVCRGVQHAHQNGVLHRDLKPSNVLVTEVDGRPVPKIIDFGIAKGMDRPLAEVTQLTGDGGVVGTLAYLSPEAIQPDPSTGPIDTRADVFALGVLLHELLVGSRPHDFSAQSTAEVLRRILEADAPPPSRHFGSLAPESRERRAALRSDSADRLEGRLRGDLDWICLRACARLRDERYAHVGELTADIERHLQDRPVLAAAPSRRYLAKKFVRRHRGAVIGGSVLLASLLLGIVGTSTGYLRARAARADADRQASVAEREAELALQSQKESETVLRFVIDLFEASEPGAGPGAQRPVGEVLSEGADRLRTQLQDQPAVRARLLSTVGNIYRRLGSWNRSLELLQESVAIEEERAAGGTTLELANARESLAMTLDDLGRNDEAEELLRKVVETRTELLPEGDLLVSQSYRNLANALKSLGRHEEALEMGRRVVETYEAAGDMDEVTLGRAIAGLAGDLENQGHVEESLAAYRRALEIFRRVEGEDHFLVGMVLLNMSGIESGRNRFEAAEPMLRQALENLEGSLGAEHPYVFMASLNLGVLLRVRLQFEEAEQVLLEALEQGRRVSGPEHPDVILTIFNLGLVYMDTQRYEQAERSLAEAIDMHRRTLPADHPRLAAMITDLADLHCRLDRVAEAEPLAREAVAILESRNELDQIWAGLPLRNLGCVLRKKGEFVAAEQAYRKSLELRRREAETADTMNAKILLGLGQSLLGQNRVAEAEGHVRDAVALFERQFPADDPWLLEARATLERLQEP